MKKVLPIFMALFFVLPISNVFAAVDLSNINYYNSSLYDERNDTGINVERIIGKTINENIIIFKEPTNIYEIRGNYFQTDYKTAFKVIFYNSEKEIVGTQDISTLNFHHALDINDVKSINLESIVPGYGFDVREFHIKASMINYSSISDLSESNNFNSVNLKWVNPNSENFNGTIIKKNGVEIATLDSSKDTYKITGLTPETTYNFSVTAKYSDGGLSKSVSVAVKTDEAPQLEPAGDVTKLMADADHDRVDLSWALPASDNFKHVNIYRDEIVQTTFIDAILGVKLAHAAATKIFETNGTYFNDLTVKPETTYEYTLTTTSTESLESDGVTATVTTPKKPKPELGGGGYEKDPITGDFTYYWTEPSTGQVKIYVGGKEYKTVLAADKKIIIPKNDMKYTVMGDPDVSMIVIDKDGDESVPIKPPHHGEGSDNLIGNVKLPFTSKDLLSSGMGLLLVIGPIVLLILAFLVVPKLRKILMQALGKKKDDGKESTRRFATDVNTTEIKGQRERDLKEKVAAAPKIPREREFKEPRVRREKREREERTERAQRERVRRERATRAERGGN